jgi:hypothetical protein
LKINLIFLLKLVQIKKNLKTKSGLLLVTDRTTNTPNKQKDKLFFLPTLLPSLPLVFFLKNQKIKKILIPKTFLINSITTLKSKKLLLKTNLKNNFFFLNLFLLSFLEFFFKKSIIFNLKKGTNKLILKQISFRKFSVKYFKKNLKTNKQIIGVLYYSLLLKDSSIFVNFFKKILENLNIKLHKKLFLGLRKLLKDFFKPIFFFLGVKGVFFNVKGKIGVSGSAKKRRYFFYFGEHSITSRTLKMDLKYSPI